MAVGIFTSPSKLQIPTYLLSFKTVLKYSNIQCDRSHKKYKKTDI